MRQGVMNVGLAGVLLILGVYGCTAEAVDLLPKFPEGRVTYYHTTMKAVQTMRTGETAVEMTTTTDTAIRLTVKRVLPNGEAEVEYATLYLATGGGPPHMPMNFDTRKPDDPSSNPALRGISILIDHPVLLNIAPNGSINKITGLDEVTRSLPSEVSPVFSEAALRQLHESFYPGRTAPQAAKAGATWKDQMTGSMAPLGTLVKSLDYRLEKIDAGSKVANIVMKAVLNLQPASGEGPATASIKNGKANARFSWDLAVGELIQYESEVRMTLAMGGGGTPAGRGMVINHALTTTTRRVALESLDLPPAKATVPKPPGD